MPKVEAIYKQTNKKKKKTKEEEATFNLKYAVK